MKILSEYFGDEIDRHAEIYFDENSYKVRVRNELGSYFVAFFNNIDEAENFAENYVRGETHEP
jgi:hypothetical protein